MSGNGKALVATAIAGLLVIGTVYWWKRSDDNPDTPRAGCTTVVVAASVEKSDLMDAVAKRYNSSDRQVNGSCYGISVTAMASGVVESRLTEASWDPAWGPAPDAWSPAASTWLQLLRHDRASHDRPDILAADNESVVSTPIVLAMPEPKAKALGWPQAAIGWSDLLEPRQRPARMGVQGPPRMGRLQARQDQPQRVHVRPFGDHRRVRGRHRHVQRPHPGRAEGTARARFRCRSGEVGRALRRHRAHLPDEPATSRRCRSGARLCQRGGRRGEVRRGLQRGQSHRRPRDEGSARQAAGAAGRDLSEGGHARQRQPLRDSSGALVRGGQAGRRQGLPGLPA